MPFLPLMWMPFFWLRIHYIHLEDYVDFKTTCARTRNVTISYGCKIWLPEWLEGKLIVKKPRLLERLKIWDVTRVEPAPRDGTQMIVVGLLPTGQDRDFNVLVPKEVCWTFGNEMNVLLALKKSAFRLRGMKNWFSFKHVGRLGVYRVSILIPKSLTHLPTVEI